MYSAHVEVKEQLVGISFLLAWVVWVPGIKLWLLSLDGKKKKKKPLHNEPSGWPIMNKF